MMEETNYRLITAPGMYDDLGQVLNWLGYRYESIHLDGLSNLNLLRNCRVVFVPCGAQIGNFQAIETLRKFVETGGSMYVSDLSYSVIDLLFPGKVRFGTVEYNSNITGEVKDPGLKEIIGKSIKLHMDYTSAAGVNSVNNDTQVLIEGSRKGGREKHPFLISFSYGEGQVIYTVFHNAKQVNETEKKLLNYLIFRPIMSGAANKATALVQAQMATPGKEIFASINNGETSSRYGVQITTPQTVLFVLSWEEKSVLGLQVWDPSGKMVKEQFSDKNPLTIEVPAAQSGTWSCAVKAQNVPHRNFPFVLTIATRGGVQAIPSQIAQPIATKLPASTVLPALKVLPIYLVLDTSRKASDVLNPLLPALRQFAYRVQSRPCSTVAPHLGLVLVNDTGQMAVPLGEPRNFNVPSLRAQGSCNLGITLNTLLGSLTSSTGAKPLLIFLLSGTPDDNYASKADQLHSLASKGMANVFTFGIGGGIDRTVLNRLATAPPLVLPVVTQMYAQQLFEWLYNITDTILIGLEGGGSGKKSVPPPPECLRTS
jgi:uncharacterized protein YegL